MPGVDSVDRYKLILARETRPEEEALDAVYERYAKSNPFLPVTHFVDHVTMGAEALVGMGLGGRVGAWVARQPVRPYAPPSKGIAIATDWATALGRPECHGDWSRQLESELREGRFQDVLARWAPRFAHEAGAWLFHGLIRTAHAVRALDHRDTPARRGELARGLALWAIGIKHQPLGERLEAARNVVIDAEISRFARAGAATFINAPSAPNLHLVTGPMAYLLIAHHLDASSHRIALASFARTHARAVANLANEVRTAQASPIPTLDESQLELLVKDTDAHPAKLTEAALRAYALTEDELFLKAAGKAQGSTAVGRKLRRAGAHVDTKLAGRSTS